MNNARVPVWAAAVTDAVCLVVFVLGGIASHEESLLIGIGRVLWPFALAAAIAWTLTRAWRAPARLWPTGILIWLFTVLGGLALRDVSGQGIAWSFALVTTLFLAVTMVGWRALVAVVQRRHVRAPR